MSSFLNNYLFKTGLFLCSVFLLGTIFSQAQNLDEFVKGKLYTIDTISVSGIKTFSDQTVISYSQLRKGQKINIPGDEISSIINKLWNLQLFSDINFYITKFDGDRVGLEIEIEELPTLGEVKITGLKSGKIDPLVDETELSPGKKLSESFLTNTKNYIINKFKKDGFINTKVNFNMIEDSLKSNTFKMLVNVDLGERVKIKEINFEGNKIFNDKKLRSKLKKTKKRFPLRFWKKSKLLEDEYAEDKQNLLDFFKEKGYRDARILKDSMRMNDDNTLSIDFKIEEGNRYYFGDINFLGNSIYSDFQLAQILGIKKGDAYNGVLLKKRIADEKPDANDLSNLYQNNGYLFSSINAVEVSAENDTINFEIRVNEGKIAQFNKISVVGNTKTNDHVIYRELRTKPGELYSKDMVVRTVRELGKLGFFDAENINPDFKNVDPNAGTVDIEYGLTEAGASQIELQGGYGGGGFIGTLGLSFNNFSMKNIFNLDTYKPLPMGDGQSLSLRLQASQFYSTYSFSFAEPWLGGRQPVQFSTSLSHTVQYRYDFFTGRADKSQYFQISGLTLVTFGDGQANNLSYTLALSRNHTFTHPIFPIGGSKFTISAKLTPPYSLISGVDYSSLESQKAFQLSNGNPNTEKIDQEKFRWLEYYKLKFNGEWYTTLIGKLVLKTQTDFGFIGAYNNERGNIPFERFYLGGDGMQNYALDGRETIALRGYKNQSLSSQDGSLIYNKFTVELRYPLTLKPSASIFALSFLESGNGYNNFRDFNPFNSKRSAGMGVRIFMPAFGLLGIDFGYGFDNPTGANEPNGWETHFIIGQQF